MATFDGYDDGLELPTVELRDAAFKLFGETTVTRREKIAQLRALIETLPTTDQLSDLSGENLIRFLRGRKFDVHKALKSAVNMARFYRDHPDWTNGIDEEDFSIFQSWIQLLEKRDNENRVIMILRLAHGIHSANVDFLKNNPLKLVRWNVWFLNRLTQNLDAQVYGITVINAFGGITTEDAAKLRSIINISERIAIFQFIAGCCPFRLKGAYIFDEPALFRWLWGIIYYFLSQKLRERIHICGSQYDAIQEVVSDASILPRCIGGGVDDETYDWKSSFERFKVERF
jgi:hypothetical protein